MRTVLALFSLVACLISTAYATALTYRLEAHEKACYFAQVEHKGTKLAFYFAVRPMACDSRQKRHERMHYALYRANQ